MDWSRYLSSGLHQQLLELTASKELSIAILVLFFAALHSVMQRLVTANFAPPVYNPARDKSVANKICALICGIVTVIVIGGKPLGLVPNCWEWVADWTTSVAGGGAVHTARWDRADLPGHIHL